MTLTTEELNKYTTLAVELKRLEEFEKQHNAKSEALYQGIRDDYKHSEMKAEIATLADERSVELQVIQDKIEILRLEMVG